MKRVDKLIAVASWEPRFYLGLKRLTQQVKIKRFEIFYFREYAERTDSVRKEAALLARNHDISCSMHELCFEDPAASWREISSTVRTDISSNSNVLVDITTMPRETIWSVLFWLEVSRANVSYVYHRPESYSQSWLARDPDPPRFAFKLAGSPELDKPTAVVAVTGYDNERAVQAIDFLEPSQAILFRQIGDQLENCERRVDESNLILSRDLHVQVLEIDAYSADHGFTQLYRLTRDLANTYNVVMFSFGPKPSAVCLFRVQRRVPQVSLAYIHCKDYSEAYSTGIGATLQGALALQPESA